MARYCAAREITRRHKDGKHPCLTPRAGFATPVHRYTCHKGSVKALAWSPHQASRLATGGGTADK
jgi:WD40 repeat protein